MIQLLLNRKSRIVLSIEPHYGHFLSTWPLPASSYSCEDIHICWKEPIDANIDPPTNKNSIWKKYNKSNQHWIENNKHLPIHAPKRRSAEPFAAMVFNRTEDGVLAARSRANLSAQPFAKVPPPVTTTDPHMAGFISISHIPTAVCTAR